MTEDDIYFFTKIRLCKEYGKFNLLFQQSCESDRTLACDTLARGVNYGLYTLKCFGQAQRGFCSCVCVDITAKH